MEFNEKLQQLRKQNNLTQEQLAETENKSNLENIYNFISCIVDVMAVALIFLPLYGREEGGYIYAVNLLSFTEQTKMNIMIYWGVFITMIGLGVLRLVLTKFDKGTWSGIATKCSMILGAFAVCFFAAAKEPYATTLLFLFFIMKMLLWMKIRETL